MRNSLSAISLFSEVNFHPFPVAPDSNRWQVHTCLLQIWPWPWPQLIRLQQICPPCMLYSFNSSIFCCYKAVAPLFGSQKQMLSKARLMISLVMYFFSKLFTLLHYHISSNISFVTSLFYEP